MSGLIEEGRKQTSHLPGPKRGPKRHGKCKVCNCAGRAEVELMYFTQEETTLSEISEFLKKKYKVDISRSAIERHCKNHCIPEGWTKDQYIKERTRAIMKKEELMMEYVEDSKAIMGEIVQHNIEELQKIDAMIEQDFSLYDKVIEEIDNEMDVKGKPSHSNVQLLLTLNKNINQSMDTKMKLLGTDAQSRAADAVDNWVALLGRAQEGEEDE